MAFGGVNYLAIVIAGIAGWLVGAAWYMALAKPWMAAQGWTSKAEMLGGEGRRPSPVPFVIAFVALLVMAWALAGVIGHLGPGQATLGNGVISAFFIWLGFVITTMVVNYSFSGRKPALSLIDGGHWLAVLLAQGAIIGWMGPG